MTVLSNLKIEKKFKKKLKFFFSFFENTGCLKNMKILIWSENIMAKHTKTHIRVI